jgi:hypothetical protein
MLQRFVPKMSASLARVYSKLAHRDFDPAFYHSYYGDICHLKSDESLHAHYYRHGHKEGRYKNLEEALQRLQERFGALPEDFNPHMYGALNTDLAGLSENELKLIAHFLEHGRQENRPYIGDADLLLRAAKSEDRCVCGPIDQQNTIVQYFRSPDDFLSGISLRFGTYREVHGHRLVLQLDLVEEGVETDCRTVKGLPVLRLEVAAAGISDVEYFHLYFPTVSNDGCSLSLLHRPTLKQATR